MDEEGYGVTVIVEGETVCEAVADSYEAAVAVVRAALDTCARTAAGTSQIDDLVDDRVVVYDEGSVAELLAWTNGTPRR